MQLREVGTAEVLGNVVGPAMGQPANRLNEPTGVGGWRGVDGPAIALAGWPAAVAGTVRVVRVQEPGDLGLIIQPLAAVARLGGQPGGHPRIQREAHGHRGTDRRQDGHLDGALLAGL